MQTSQRSRYSTSPHQPLTHMRRLMNQALPKRPPSQALHSHSRAHRHRATRTHRRTGGTGASKLPHARRGQSKDDGIALGRCGKTKLHLRRVDRNCHGNRDSGSRRVFQRAPSTINSCADVLAKVLRAHARERACKSSVYHSRLRRSVFVATHVRKPKRQL